MSASFHATAVEADATVAAAAARTEISFMCLSVCLSDPELAGSLGSGVDQAGWEKNRYRIGRAARQCPAAQVGEGPGIRCEVGEGVSVVG